MKRRDFIRLSAYSTALLSVPFVWACHYKPANAAIVQPVFLSRIMDAKSIREAGQQYAKQVPDEATTDKLEKILLEGSPVNGSTDPGAVHQYFAQKVNDDFAKKQTVIVDGWVLSGTEARQCALYALSEN